MSNSTVPSNALHISEIADLYDELLCEFFGDQYGCIDIAGMKFDVAKAFKKLDHIAYREGLLNYIDTMEYVEIDGCRDYYVKNEL